MRSHTRTHLAAAASTLLLLAVMATRSTAAINVDDTRNTANYFEGGTVTVTDDDAATALFESVVLTEGETGSACINVTYAGSLDAAVGLYGSIDAVASTGLESYLQMRIAYGTGAAGGADADCTGFSAVGWVEEAYIDLARDPNDAGDTDGWFDLHSDYTTADTTDAWQPTGGSGEVRSYRVDLYLPNDLMAADNTEVTFTLTWEAQSR